MRDRRPSASKIMDLEFVEHLVEDQGYLREVIPSVWLCDNHKWAISVWESVRSEAPPGTRFCLCHADYHWDDLDNVSTEWSPDKLRTATSEQIRSLILASHYYEGQVIDRPYIGYDSFIAPAVIRGYLSSVHFYCLQDEDINVDHLFEDVTRIPRDIKLVIHTSVSDFGKVSDRPLIFDLCLDLFNRNEEDLMYKGTPWSAGELDDFFGACAQLIP